MLGLIFFEGDYVQQDIEKAIYYFQLASEKNNKNALFSLGIILYEGVFVPKNIDKSIRYLRFAANQDLNIAQFYLGRIYYEGEYVSQDIDIAIRYLTLSAANKYYDAQFYLGSIYYEGLYVDYDIEKSIHYFKEASCFNNQYAKNNLGIIYKKGQGVEPRIANTIEYFNEAIQQKNDAVAMFNLAHIYFYEEGVQSDLKKAMELIVKSLLSDIPHSLDLLCLIVLKKYQQFSIDDIKKDFENISKDSGEDLAEIVFEVIFIYEKLFMAIKDINLVYYGFNIENQTMKEKIEKIDNRSELNSYFYEGFDGA
ncbi:hypothetical protein M9Y10_036967 [Tritrichomonas musculus]|uniref:Sel1 repeat family protein n=1 Tax=Tritrichomonas musculus TaxID=1915356 RepID=A0ABR2GSS1_9EUKA